MSARISFRDLIAGANLSGVSDKFNGGVESGFPLEEARFDAKKLERVVELYSKVIGRKMKGRFKIISTENYNRASGPGKGIRTMNDYGQQVRFNWDKNLSKRNDFILTSIDYWDETNLDFQKPTRTVTFGPNLNVLQVMDKIVDGLRTGAIRENLNEKPTEDDKKDWLISKGLPKSLARSERKMRDRAEKEGLTDELEMFLGKKETNEFEKGLQNVEKKFTKEVYADPDTVFDDIEDLLSVVAAKKWRTLVVCGMGGIGKCLQSEQTVNIKGLPGL